MWGLLQNLHVFNCCNAILTDKLTSSNAEGLRLQQMMDRTLLEMVGLWSSSVPPPTHTVKRLAPTEGCYRLQWGLHLSLCQHEDPSCTQSSRQLWGRPQLQCLNGRATFQGQLKVTFSVYMYMLGLCIFWWEVCDQYEGSHNWSQVYFNWTFITHNFC